MSQEANYPLSQTAAGHKLTLRACVRDGNPVEAFNHFIMAWVDPKWHGHLLDNDCNDAEYVRDAIRAVPSTSEGRTIVDPDGELAARQILRAYIDDERLVRKAYGELFGGSSSEEDEK